MGQPIQRIPKPAGDPGRRAAERALLLERVALGLAHEGKNPLHNMALHLQLLADKLAQPDRPGGSPIEKHLAALRDGIGSVDHLLKAWAEFASPEHLPPDLGAALHRALQLFAYDARRAGVQLETRAPPALLVDAESRLLGDLVAHALLACVELCREGGKIAILLDNRGAVATLELRGEGGVGSREHAQPHLDAARSLAADAACELSIDPPAAGSARLSLSFLHPR